MGLKEEILGELINNKGIPISGQNLADKYKVSRAAVWKAINALKNEGYLIEGVTNRGYILSDKNDIISKQAITKYLDEDIFDITVYDELESTNITAKQLAQKGAPEGSVTVARHQSGGYGRMRRAFYSPKSSGLYMSVILRPDIEISSSFLITVAAAAATAQAIEKICHTKTGIKWVNDIFIGGKKVCGILTEAGFLAESNKLDYAVLGIGVNIYTPDNGFPPELKDIAASILDANRDNEEIRNRLCAEILNRFWPYYRELAQKKYLQEYKSRSIIIGKEITIIDKDKEKKAKAIDIDDDFRLIAETPDSQKLVLSSGEVSVRL